MGNTRLINNSAFSYDGYGRMVSAPQVTFAYNALGERTRKTLGNTATRFHYGPDGQLLYEASGTTSKAYVTLNGRPLARIDDNQAIYYYHDDPLGTPQAMTDAAGTTVWKADYEPFGKAAIRTQTVMNNLRLPGQYFDAETGLHYNYFRDYDPGTGRYVESDPIGLVAGMNVFAYADGNPLIHSDWSGLDYWIEGPATEEGGMGFHQSVCVGQYSSASNRKCISFGVEDENTCDGTKCKGKVYMDDSAAGAIVFGRYRQTTAAQDKRISAFFDELNGRDGDYDLIKNNCRDFSYRLFRSLEFKFGGR